MLILLYLMCLARDTGCPSPSFFSSVFWIVFVLIALFFVCEAFYLRQTAPRVVWTIKCYHYETRTRTVQDSQGRSTTRTETYQVRVNTHRACGDCVALHGQTCLGFSNTPSLQVRNDKNQSKQGKPPTSATSTTISTKHSKSQALQHVFSASSTSMTGPSSRTSAGLSPLRCPSFWPYHTACGSPA